MILDSLRIHNWQAQATVGIAGYAMLQHASSFELLWLTNPERREDLFAPSLTKHSSLGVFSISVVTSLDEFVAESGV